MTNGCDVRKDVAPLPIASIRLRTRAPCYRRRAIATYWMHHTTCHIGPGRQGEHGEHGDVERQGFPIGKAGRQMVEVQGSQGGGKHG